MLGLACGSHPYPGPARALLLVLPLSRALKSLPRVLCMETFPVGLQMNPELQRTAQEYKSVFLLAGSHRGNRGEWGGTGVLKVGRKPLWRPEPEEGTGWPASEAETRRQISFVEFQERPFPRPVPVPLVLLCGL